MCTFGRADRSFACLSLSLSDSLPASPSRYRSYCRSSQVLLIRTRHPNSSSITNFQFQIPSLLSSNVPLFGTDFSNTLSLIGLPIQGLFYSRSLSSLISGIVIFFTHSSVCSDRHTSHSFSQCSILWTRPSKIQLPFVKLILGKGPLMLVRGGCQFCESGDRTRFICLIGYLFFYYFFFVSFLLESSNRTRTLFKRR